VIHADLREILQQCPHSYEALTARHGKTIEHPLNVLLKSGLVVKIPRGNGHVYGVPPPPPADEGWRTLAKRQSKPKPKNSSKRKRCPRCLLKKKRSEFYVSGYCKPCGLEKSRADNLKRTEWRRANRTSERRLRI
jgi:hypothetical protein